VPAKPEPIVRMAVRGCLVRCADSDTPLTSLAEFAEELRRLGWDKKSIRDVEFEVIQVLGRRDGRDRRNQHRQKNSDSA